MLLSMKRFKDKFLKKETSCPSSCDWKFTEDEDVEVDGFVVVGETADEKTTVHADAKSDSPPSYSVSLILNVINCHR